MSYEIIPLRDEHLEAAAAVFTTGYQVQREHEPSLPSRYENATTMLPLLRDLTRQAPGVAAIRGGRLAGFLMGQVLSMFRGRRSVYTPEWAHAADVENRREIYRDMYARLSPRWVANGCFSHVITILAHDRPAIDAFFWLGSGLIAVDAMRDLGPVQGPMAQVEIRRAGLEDIELVMTLGEKLQRHMAAAPTFLAFTSKRERESHEQLLTDSTNALWLAYQGGEAVGYMRLGPSNPSAAYVIRDEKTASITGAFTKEHARNRGIGTALLKHSLDWARSVGYERCAVDFEPENIPSARFWLKHFQPVCYSLIRNVDERVAWAHEGRNDGDIW